MIERLDKKWEQRFLSMCENLAGWSSCLSRQIGAILVRDKVIISTGYNGPPRSYPHCGGKENICPRKDLGYGSGEGLDLCPALHAEEKCIVNAARIGVRTSGSVMYMSCGVPCKDCLKKIINADIDGIVCTSRVYYDDLSVSLLRESRLVVRTYGN